jgi:hypothetical protein
MSGEGCVVLVPVAHHIEPACESALRVLEARGYLVMRVYGYSQIDLARSELATQALQRGYDELMWIDADMGFDPDCVDQLRQHNLPIVGGIYVKKGVRELAIDPLPGTEEIVFGAEGGLLKIQYAATGFLYTRRAVYDAIQAHWQLPVCNERFQRPVIPYFQPLTIAHPSGSWYLSEDWSFCQRAREAGFAILADTRLRLWHIGAFGYGWENAGSGISRFATYRYRLQDAEQR